MNKTIKITIPTSVIDIVMKNFNVASASKDEDTEKIKRISEELFFFQKNQERGLSIEAIQYVIDDLSWYAEEHFN